MQVVVKGAPGNARQASNGLVRKREVLGGSIVHLRAGKVVRRSYLGNFRCTRPYLVHKILPKLPNTTPHPPFLSRQPLKHPPNTSLAFLLPIWSSPTLIQMQTQDDPLNHPRLLGSPCLLLVVVLIVDGWNRVCGCWMWRGDGLVVVSV